MNEYFQTGAVPAPSSPGASSVMRQEFANIAAGFDKLPVLAGHAGEIVTVNATGTALVTTGAPIGNYVTKDGVFTLTNKTMAWADNIWPGFGTGATKNAGKMANQVLLLENNMQLPAIDGSLLTGMNAGMISGVVQILQGGTGASDVTGAQHNLGIDLKAPIHNPVFTGAPSAPTPPTGDTSSRLATTWFVTNTINAIGAVTASDELPLMDGVAAPGNPGNFKVSRDDHVHPSDTSRAPASAATAAGTSFAPAGGISAANVQAALQELDTEKAPLASPNFTGVPTAPTVADSSDTTTKIATTAWVQTRLVQIPVGVQLSNSNAQNLGAAPAPGVGVEASRWDHVHAFPIASQIPSVATGDVSATNVQAAIAELASEKSPVGHTHVAADVTNLSAALVPFTPVSSIGATNVQAAISEVAAETVPRVAGETGAAVMPTGTTAQRPSAVEGYFRRNSEIGQWEGYTGSSWVAVGQGNAASTPFTPSGNIAASNVQAALQEVDAEKVPYGYLSATNTPFTPYGNIAASNVQAAIQELDAETQVGLATNVSKSGDTMSGSLAWSNAGANWVAGSSKNFRLMCETQAGEAAGTLMTRLGLYYQPSLAWAGASVDFLRGASTTNGQVTIRGSSGANESTLSVGNAGMALTTTGTIQHNAPMSIFNGGARLAFSSGTTTKYSNVLYFNSQDTEGLIRGSITPGVSSEIELNPGAGGGSFQLKSTGVGVAPVSWSPASDVRLKDNITPIPDALNKLDRISGNTYNRNDLGGMKMVGVIAQEVQAVLPEGVSVFREDFLAVDPMAVTALLVEAVKELSAKNDALEARLAALEAK